MAIFAVSEVVEKNPLIPKDTKSTPEELVELEEGQTATFVDEPETNTTGDKTVKIIITEKDGSSYEIEVPYTVIDHVIGETDGERPEVPNYYVRVDFLAGNYGNIEPKEVDGKLVDQLQYSG